MINKKLMSEIISTAVEKKKKNKSKYGFLKQLNASLYYEYRTIKSDFH